MLTYEVLPIIVGCAGLSLNTVHGVVRAYLPRLECSEVVGSNNLDLNSVSLISSPSRYTSSDASLSEWENIRLVLVSLHMNDWTYPSNDLGLTGQTLSQLSSSPGLYRLASVSSCWLMTSNLWYPIVPCRYATSYTFCVASTAPYLPCVSWQGRILSTGCV